MQMNITINLDLLYCKKEPQSLFLISNKGGNPCKNQKSMITNICLPVRRHPTSAGKNSFPVYFQSFLLITFLRKFPA